MIVKPPHAYFRKPRVPNYKNQGHQKGSREKSSEMPVEFYFMMKRKNKTDKYRKKID